MIRCCLAMVAVLLLSGCQSRNAPARFTVPAGFTVEPVLAKPEEIGSIVAFTFDSHGRPVVARERQHPTTLIDADNDGIYESSKVFSDKVHTLQGLWFDGNTLYATGDSVEKQTGLYKLPDADGDGTADSMEQLSLFERGMGEHGPHEIRRGPDGRPTIILGNHTGVPAGRIDPASPLRGYKEWQLLDRYMDARGHAAGILAPGGTVVRWNEDKRNFTLLFGGFRNAYSHAYSREGEAFTFDSDMEWDVNMPWYRGIRTVHGVPGADYGWRTGSGKFPAYYFDTLPPVRDLGRGSPVGVEFYQHNLYPREYRDALFEGDWSRGRILVSTLVRDGATYKIDGPAREFVHGEPLNVTDIETGPDGSIYFSTGGRDTEGGFYRIRYRPGLWERLFGESEPEGILAVVRQPQPLSSWGHAALAKKQEVMGARWGEELEKLARDGSATAMDRIQALYLLQRFGPRPRAELLRPLSQDRDAQVRAAAVYVVGQHGSPRAQAIAAAALKDSDPLVKRRAAEAIVRMGLSPDRESFVPLDDVYALLGDGDRFVRYAGRLAIERINPSEWRDRVLRESNPVIAMEGMLALLRTPAGAADLEHIYERVLGLMRTSDAPAPQRLAALRLFGIAAAETPEGIRPTLRKQVSDSLLLQFPSGDETVDRELARVLGYCGQPEAIAKILTAMPSEDANQPLQIHYAYCLRSISEGWSAEQKNTLVRWFQKASQWRGGASFTGFINLLFDSSLAFFNDEEKKLAYRRVPAFAPAEDYKAKMAERMQRTGWEAPSVLSRTGGTQALDPQEIYEHQMFSPMTLRAKPERGKEIYEKECASCHRLGALGSDFGPDLTTLPSRFKKKDILEAILWPSKTISDQYESIIVDTRELGPVNGLLVKEDNRVVVLKTGDAPRPIEIPKADVTGRRKSEVSIMPERLLDSYGQGEIADLLAFLLAGGK